MCSLHMMNWLLKDKFMKNFILILLSLLVSVNYIFAQTQQNTQNQTQPKSNKLYLGCWINDNSSLVYFDDKSIQVSWTSEIFSYSKTEFGDENTVVLRLQPDPEARPMKPYLVLKLTSENEMTMADYRTKDYTREQREGYLNLKRENCEKLKEK